MRLNSLPWQRNAYLCSVEVAMLNIGEGGGGLEDWEGARGM